MKFNKESFEKAIKANKIVRYQKHFESVVKSYLEAETERCNISDVVRQSEQLRSTCDWCNGNNSPRTDNDYGISDLG